MRMHLPIFLLFLVPSPSFPFYITTNSSLLMSAYAFVGGTYIFTASVLQSSGQDLGCSSPKCLPLPLGTEHMKLLLLLLRQRVTITDLWKEREKT